MQARYDTIGLVFLRALCVEFCYVTFLSLIQLWWVYLMCDIDDEEKDEAPISLDPEDSKKLSMQDLDNSEVKKEANIGGEDETKSSGHESMLANNSAKDL